jgi:molybdenum cofactor biosynthesis protein B
MNEPRPAVRVATITVSDTRTAEDDEGGARLGDLLRAAGFEVVGHSIVPDEPQVLRARIDALCGDPRVDVIVTTGGTGIAPRDRTYEAIDGLLEKRLDGFGEAFRRLSWEQVGARAILSRALAGTSRGRFIAALPGSPKALSLAVTEVLAPVLPHAVALLRGSTGHDRST